MVVAKEQNGKFEYKMDGERVVISGMSGLYPRANNVKELSETLYNKKNPITSGSKRWTFNHPEVSRYTGDVPQLGRFDAQFFGVHFRLASNMDFMSRKMMEQTFQAIYDAGLNPEHLSGKKVGVYVGTCFSETEKASFYVATSRTGFGIVGCSKAMFANRISYWLNAKGPSTAIDQACCSSTVALEQAYKAIVRGECDAAIVGGGNLTLHPQSMVHYGRTIKICMDGKTKSFDQNADGCAKSEAINVLFLQKEKDALRIYAEITHVKSEFLSLGNQKDPRFGFYREPRIVRNFLNKFYDEAGIVPQAVEYVEGVGSATSEADKSELEAIGDVFCKDRSDPLLVGSVMSNIGYAEAASGISAITKVLLGYHKGQIAANLHCSTPRNDIAALNDGRMQIVREHQLFGRGFTAVNSLSITGCNAHVLLHGHYKPKDLTKYQSSIPHLVTISGRQESAVQLILDDLKSRPIDPEELALLHNIHEISISGHLGRGFTILDTNEELKTYSISEKCEYFDAAKKPLWFVYSGMGSQWAGMGAQLMRIPIFSAAIQRCDQVLKPKGIDIVHIITSPDKTIFDNILHSFVGIAAVQIGLTDILRELGLVPDNIIGHSVGELGCAYADGCFTAEEMILSAYSRGLVSIQTPFIHGSMAAVGLGYQEIVDMVPPEIEVACHNSSESSTISGPAEVMRDFVTSLANKKIFAKEVPCSNIAYHSRYIADAGPSLLKYLSEVIKDPKPRSEKWVSTSVPEDRWGDESAKYSSAEYHTNNLLNPVLFEETSRLIPPNAVLVEIAPHGLLQAILKRSLPSTCNNIPLTRRAHPNNPALVLEGIGKLFMEGYNPRVHVLYPKVEFPVSTGTPFLSHLVQWAHGEIWALPLYKTIQKKVAAATKQIVTVYDEEYRYLRGNVLRGQNVYPFAAALVAVWDTLAMSTGQEKKKVSVKFSKVELFVQPLLNDRTSLTITIALHRGSGWFEVMHGISKIANGFIFENKDEFKTIEENSTTKNKEITLSCRDVYEILHERDYCYKSDFQSLQEANETFSEAAVKWDGNWVTFIDGLLQLNALRQKHDAVSQPAFIRTLTIDTKKHLSTQVTSSQGKNVMKARIDALHSITSCGGTQVENIKFIDLSKSKNDKLSINALTFVPRLQLSMTDVKSSLEIFLQIVAENNRRDYIKVLEVFNDLECDNTQDDTLKNIIQDDLQSLNVQYEKKDILELRQNQEKYNVCVTFLQRLKLDDNILQLLSGILPADSFIVAATDCHTFKPVSSSSSYYRVVSCHKIENGYLTLARWKPSAQPKSRKTITVRSETDLKRLTLARNNLPPNHKLVVVTSYPPVEGIEELVGKWRKEANRNHVYLVMVNDKIAEESDIEGVADLHLAVNVLQSGVWGGVYYTPLAEDQSKDMHHNMALKSKHIGDLNSLSWVEMPKPSSPGIGITVHFAGLNKIDVKKATGVYHHNSDNNAYGMDFSGVTDRGDRVMGIVPSGSASKRLKGLPQLLWPVPDHWTMEEAATVPLPYAHAFYCLVIKAKAKPNLSILVHGGAGALGQAAIAVALELRMRVFATVSDMRKKRFLLKLFPELNEDHIGNSRDSSFEDMILVQTKGLGVSYVINCLKGDLRNNSLRVTTNMAITFDTEADSNFNFGMSNLMMDKNYIAVNFSSIFTEANSTDMKKLQLLVSEGIARGYVRPLTRVTYPAHEAARALRLLSTSAHRGRVLLRISDTSPPIQPRITCSSNRSHLIICDDEFHGLQLADRLIQHGAKKLVVHLPKVPTSINIKKQSWKNQNSEVKLSTTPLNGISSIQSMLEDCAAMAPIEGTYFIATTGMKKEEILVRLDDLSRKLCTHLKYFAIMSTEEEFGNQICVSRKQIGLPATKLSIPKIRKMDDAYQCKGAVSFSSALDAFETVVKTAATVAQAHPSRRPQLTLLQKIATIANIKVSGDLDDSAFLSDIGVGQEKAHAVAALFKDEYHLCLSEDNIPMLSIKQIQEMDQMMNGSLTKEVKGFDMFFSYICNDEMLATDTVFLPTLLCTSNSMQNEELEMTGTPLFIVPGLEGHWDRFGELCERLKVAALLLQPGLDFLNESVQETAKRYANVMMKKIDAEKKFCLMGYESGVLVALELASILEEHGYNGTVYCIGEAPEQFKAFLEKELQQYGSGEALQESLIRHMFGVMGGRSEVQFCEGTSWQEKVEVCVRALMGHIPLSTQYVRGQFNAARARLFQTIQYTPRLKPLRSRLILIRPENFEVVYPEPLQKYSEQPIIVHNLRSTLAHVLKDLRCAAIVNQYLDPDVLEEYENKNLCDTYILDANKFLTAGVCDDDE
ncbi:fatty acid synthase-like [Ostrinia furnacalis]|uniref:fatty acid synthase-like n=1 Tax=Ostrinia furnacalis TaxID=93504 RepID=UPI0010403133|nr:fatty acid synthase-like [Ostrinia furnacalis]